MITSLLPAHSGHKPRESESNYEADRLERRDNYKSNETDVLIIGDSNLRELDSKKFSSHVNTEIVANAYNSVGIKSTLVATE